MRLFSNILVLFNTEKGLLFLKTKIKSRQILKFNGNLLNSTL